MYDSGRYLTLTVHRLEAKRNGSSQVEPREAQIIELHQRVFGPVSVEPIPQNGAAPSLGDEELLARARTWKNGGDFSLLFDHGDWKRYSSQSEADQALCNYLAFATDRDPIVIDRLFRRSGLMRPKWDEPHYGDGRSYGAGTTEKAVAAVKEGWRPGMPLERRF